MEEILHISFTRYAKFGEQAAEAAARKFLQKRRCLEEDDRSHLIWEYQDVKWFQVGTSESLPNPTFQVRVEGMVNNWRVKIHVQMVEGFKGASNCQTPVWAIDKVFVFDNMGLGIAEEFSAEELDF